MTLNSDDLAGTWTLTSFVVVENGVLREGPLGDAPSGQLIYGTGGELSVSMMSTTASHRYMGYSGTWEAAEGRLRHHIETCSRPDWVGTSQERKARVINDQLIIESPTATGATSRVTWSRRTDTTERGGLT